MSKDSDHDHDHDRDCRCHKTKCCERGPQGIQGPQGVQGIQGIEGPVGPKGDCSDCPPVVAIAEYAEVYSAVSQTLALSSGPNLPGGAVMFENTIVSTANIDASTAATNGQLVIKTAGWYELEYGVGAFINPIPSPLPVWSVSLFRNGAYIPGSTVCTLALSPTQQANEVVADTLVHFKAGDSVMLASTTDVSLFLNSPSLGTTAQPNSAYLVVKLLKAD